VPTVCSWGHSFGSSTGPRGLALTRGFRPGQHVPVVIAGTEVGLIAVNDILP